MILSSAMTTSASLMTSEAIADVRLRMQDILDKPVSTVTVQDINELWVLKDDLRKLGRQW